MSWGMSDMVELMEYVVQRMLVLMGCIVEWLYYMLWGRADVVGMLGDVVQWKWIQNWCSEV
jgi:hypothetical protein